MNTKTTPVVNRTADKKEECCCNRGCECCNCGCQNSVRTILLCGSIMVSAALIAAAITFRPFERRQFMPMPMRQMPPMEMKMPKMDKQIQEFVMNNPKVLIESVDKFYKSQEMKEAAAAPAKKKVFDFNALAKADATLVKQIIDDKTNYSLGNKKGTFVIIEFFDYNCGWCKRTNKALEEVIAKAEGKNIRWIPIDTPIFGEGSETIARYVLAAGEQGKYAEMHKVVGEATERLDEEGLLKIAKDLKLDVAKLKKAANGKKIKDKLAANNEFRQKLNINGVPMVIVDGRINPGALFGENLDAVVKLSAK